MKKGSAINLILLSFLLFCILPSSANAGVTCSDVAYGSERYHEKMEELAKLGRLPDAYFNRYHEDVVSNVCKGNFRDVEGAIDRGFVKKSEVEAIKEVLGIDTRSDMGKNYGYARQKFSDIGLCSACADNVAQYYARKPNSKCGKLARQALEGKPGAVAELKAFPAYCKWKY